jgi:hypothetical protein
MIDRVADEVVRGYVKEVCEILGYDMSNVRIIYVPRIPTYIGIPQHAAITPDGCLILDESWVNQEINNETPTKTRCEIYCKVRMLYQQANSSQKFNQYSNEAIDDAIAFSCALLTIKGLTLPMPQNPLVVRYLLDKTHRILKEEFGMNTEYYLMPKEIVNNEFTWKYRLTKKEESKYNNHYFANPPISTVRVIDETEKGTIGNPFEDVNEAFDYILELERDAYNRDTLLQDIENQRYFYDLVSHQFRVPWASPFVANNHEFSIPEDGFIVNQNELHSNGVFHFTLKPNLRGRKFLFRGQSKDYPGPCVPNLFRKKEQTYFLDPLIWGQEMIMLLNSHPLIKCLQDGVEIMHDLFRIFMNKYGLTQHYYNKTSFLDLTSNVETAKFFATTGYDRKTDRYFPIHDSDALGVIFCYELQMPGAMTRRNNDYSLSVIGKQVFMRSGAQHGFLLDMAKGLDFKKLPEVGMFYFRHKNSISDEIFKRSDYGKKYFAMDILQESWETIYKKRWENRIVSEDAVRLNVSFNKGETFESICEKLKAEGIEIDKHKPEFSQDLLNDYFNSIKNGWWEEFCSDIYFLGGDGALYKDCLMNIPKKPKYKSAFVRE